ncbi:MAG: hypothetical protein R2939_00600 [Kofleriaceae bacterium]
MPQRALPPEITAASLSVLAPLLTTVDEVCDEAPPTAPGARALVAQRAALAAWVRRLAPTTGAARRAPTTPPPLRVDPSFWRARLMWLAGVLRRAIDHLGADPASRAVVVKTLGQVELASLAV